WESGVWTRIERRRRIRRLEALVLAAVSLWGGVQIVHHRTAPSSAPVRVGVELLGTLRPDGSSALPGVWQGRFEGAELRIYRNAMGMVHRCPGSAGCTAAEGGGALALRVQTAGEYRALVFSRAEPGDGLSLLGDLEAARRRGDRVGMSAPLIAY